MDKRTFEIIAKWAAKESNVKIVLEENINPKADVKTNTIFMPTNISDTDRWKALMLCLHEAGHLRHSKKVPIEDLIDKDDQNKFFILNAAEDIRIDKKMFTILPNVMSWYGKAYELFTKDKQWIESSSSLPIYMQVLQKLIFSIEGFSGKAYPKFDKKVSDMIDNLAIENDMYDLVQALDAAKWDKVKEKIDEIYKKFKLDKQPKQKFTPPPSFFSQGDEGDDDGKNKAKAPAGMSGKLDDKKGNKSGSGDGGGANPADLMGTIKTQVSKCVQGGGTGAGQHASTANTKLSGIELENRTKQSFKDMLSVKETKQIDEGLKLNVDSLTTFFTGQVDDLFCDDIVIKKKKSKILILLDGSGSMVEKLLDRKERKDVAGSCCKELCKLMEETHSIEGGETDYDIHLFTERYIAESKDSWEKAYSRLSGGTNLINAFTGALSTLEKDQTITGKRILIVITDGEVDDQEIKEVKSLLLKTNNDTRVMFIGIGANPASDFAETVLMDRNIISSDYASTIIYETIMDML